jgi:hypothetical protein
MNVLGKHGSTIHSSMSLTNNGKKSIQINEGKHVSTIHSSMAWTSNGKKNVQNK